MSSIDRSCVVASFSLGGKKIKQKFWMQSNKKDRVGENGLCVPSAWLNSCLACRSFCWAQILNRSSCVEVCPTPLALGSTETTLAAELRTKNLTRSSQISRKKQRWDGWTASPKSQLWEIFFPSIVCFSFGESSSGFSFHPICPCKSRV